MKFQVITKVPDADGPDAWQNVALACPTYVINFADPTSLSPVSTVGIDPLSLRSPVFTLGEVMIVDDATGREVVGRGRKASKWGVEVREFDTVEEAVACAKDVME